MERPTNNHFPIHPLLRNRWSPRAFSEMPIEANKVQSLFEAARWSPSAANQQPWRYIIGLKEEQTHGYICKVLARGNVSWASRAPLLGIVCGKIKLNDDKGDNPWYQYDAGQSMAHLTMQASNEGLYVHQMGGFDKALSREYFQIPEPFEPLVAFAIGYLGNPALLDEFNRSRETEARKRLPFNDWVFSGKFGDSHPLFNEINYETE